MQQKRSIKFYLYFSADIRIARSFPSLGRPLLLFTNGCPAPVTSRLALICVSFMQCQTDVSQGFVLDTRLMRWKTDAEAGVVVLHSKTIERCSVLAPPPPSQHPPPTPTCFSRRPLHSDAVAASLPADVPIRVRACDGFPSRASSSWRSEARR